MRSVSADSFTLSSVSPHRSEHKSPTLSSTPSYLQRIQWTNYEQHEGVCIATEGEVARMLPEPKPYFRARMTSLRYEFPQ
jgi:hypothetical protein